MMSDFRWVRLLKRPSVYQRIGLYHATWHPPAVSVARMSDPMVEEPIASSRILTRHPALAPSAKCHGELLSDVARSIDVRLGGNRRYGRELPSAWADRRRRRCSGARGCYRAGTGCRSHRRPWWRTRWSRPGTRDPGRSAAARVQKVRTPLGIRERGSTRGRRSPPRAHHPPCSRNGFVLGLERRFSLAGWVVGMRVGAGICLARLWPAHHVVHCRIGSTTGERRWRLIGRVRPSSCRIGGRCVPDRGLRLAPWSFSALRTRGGKPFVTLTVLERHLATSQHEANDYFRSRDDEGVRTGRLKPMLTPLRVGE